MPEKRQLAKRTLIDKSIRRLMDSHLWDGLNVYRGHITHPVVAQDLVLPDTPSLSLLGEKEVLQACLG